MKPFDPRLLRAAPEVRGPLIMLGAIGVLQGIATIVTAFALASLLSAVARGEPADRVVLAAALAAGAFAARAVCVGAQEWAAARAGATVQTRLRRRLLAAWLSGPAGTPTGAGEAATLASQAPTSLEPYVARYLPALVGAATVPLLTIITLAFVDLPSAGIVALTVPLLPLFAAIIGMRTRDHTQARWRTLRDLAGHYQDVVQGLPTLVGYGRAHRQVETIRTVSDQHRRASVRTLRIAFMSSAALELLATICVAIVAVTVGLRLVYGHLDLEVGLLAILLAPEAYWPVRRVGAEFHAAADGAVAIEDILRQIDDQPRIETRREGAPTLQATDIAYAYPGSAQPVLAAINIDLGSGLLAITGPSGSGKTTLLEVLAGLREPDSGAISRGGEVHLVTQRPFLWSGTLRENLLLGAPVARRGQLDQVIERVDLATLIAALPDGLDTTIGDDGFGLSAGQRTRVVLARALLSVAPVVLLDEPSAHLDPVSLDLVHAIIGDLAKTRTVVVATHHPDLIVRADARVDLAWTARELERV